LYNNKCNLNGTGPWSTGSNPDCVSYWGAFDMVGNVWEWTTKWYGQGPDDGADGTQKAAEFHGDGYWNVDRAELTGVYSGKSSYFPPAAIRGGGWANGAKGGVFSINFDRGVGHSAGAIGFRCCISR